MVIPREEQCLRTLPVRLLCDMARLEVQRLLWLPSEATEDSLSLPGPLSTLIVCYSVI